MKTLVIEDDFTSRLLLQEILQSYGPVHLAVNGSEAVDAFRRSLDEGSAYDLVCLDIMMPEMDGYEALSEMRRLEQQFGINVETQSKIIMVTTVDEIHGIRKAFYELCDAYLVKPVAKANLLKQVRSFGLMT
jgi:two-component system chemotaxis response regulator CheY